jgi:hypothetical protein
MVADCIDRNAVGDQIIINSVGMRIVLYVLKNFADGGM